MLSLLGCLLYDSHEIATLNYQEGNKSSELQKDFCTVWVSVSSLATFPCLMSVIPFKHMCFHVLE